MSKNVWKTAARGSSVNAKPTPHKPKAHYAKKSTAAGEYVKRPKDPETGLYIVPVEDLDTVPG